MSTNTTLSLRGLCSAPFYQSSRFPDVGGRKYYEDRQTQYATINKWACWLTMI